MSDIRICSLNKPLSVENTHQSANASSPAAIAGFIHAKNDKGRLRVIFVSIGPLENEFSCSVVRLMFSCRFSALP